MKRVAAPALLAFALIACAEADTAVPADAASATQSRQPQPTATPAPTEEDIAAADVLLITGETREDLELGGYGFTRKEISSPGPTIRVDADGSISLALKNVHGYIDGEDISHTFAVVAEKVESSDPLWDSQMDVFAPGEVGIITFTPATPGRYFYICTLPGHLSPHGMWGRFVVR